MYKKLFFLTLFVLVLGLSGAVQADPIDVNNYSFEVNGLDDSQITSWMWTGDLKGWTLRDPGHWASAWWGADDEWGVGFEAADGTVAIFNVTAGVIGDLEDTLEIYQILEDTDAVIAADKRYTLTFNAITLDVLEPSVGYGALYYTTGTGEYEANDVILASEAKTLTSPPWDNAGYVGWETVTVSYAASAPGIGETLGIKLSTPYPWLDGYAAALDNVHLELTSAFEAWNPSPVDGAGGVLENVTLSWGSGTLVQSTDGHEVYLGTDLADVTAGTGNTSQGPVTAPSYPVPVALDVGQLYYWRVDEVNDVTANTWTGPVWSFTVMAPKATDPTPMHGAEGVAYKATLSWTEGPQADTSVVLQR